MTTLATWVHEWSHRHPGGETVKMVTLRDAFDLALRLESRAAHLYRIFAHALGQDNAQLAARWLSLAADEETHFQTLHMASEAVDPKTSMSLFLSRSGLERLGTLMDIALVEALRPGLTSEQAISIAWEIENSEMDYLLDVLTEVPQNPDLHKQLFEMKAATGRHREKLEEVAILSLGPQAPISEWALH